MNYQYQKIIKILFTLLFIVAVMLPSFGQSRLKTRISHPWSVGLNFGPNIFLGDLRVHNFVPAAQNNSEWGWGYGGNLTRHLNPVLGIRGEMMIGTLKGTKRTVNEYFKANMFDYSLQLYVDMTNLIWPDKYDKFAFVYGYGGMGFSNWRTTVYDLNTDKAIRGNGESGNGPGGRTSEAFFPFGGGIKRYINDNWCIKLESSFHVVNTDKLDATVGGSSWDMYSYSSVGITYNIFKKSQKKPVRTNVIASADPDFDIRYDIPVRTHANSEFEMKLIVDMGTLSGAGTISQILPMGFRASDPNVLNGNFDFSDQKVTIQFDQLPELANFTLTYKVLVSDLAAGTYPIIGEFTDENSKSYQFNNNIYIEAFAATKKDNAVDTISVTASTAKPSKGNIEYRVQIRASYGQMTHEEYLEEKYQITEKIKEDYVNGWYKYTVGSFDSYRNASKYRDKLISENGITDAFVVKLKDGKLFSQPHYASGKETRTTEYMLDAESKSKIYETPWEKGTEFRIQISASVSKLSKDLLAREFGLTEPIMENYSDGWYRYSIGSYQKYWKAKEYRNILISKNGIYDAFVVGFKDGKRLQSLSVLLQGTPGIKSGSPGIAESGRIFKVQILALKKKKENTIEELMSTYEIDGQISEEKLGGYYQYTVGTFRSIEEAKRYSAKLADKGITDAFIVAYKNGNRLKTTPTF